ncbi:hypothetical protein FACS1894193_08580 [Bacilli bacterium]|nr:hypothetical protein FACS1894192_00230 [Bacilli bacterium]GHU42741.1 hypothetical protein FACS1894193_08580 [Bacilli bacterium]
MEMVMPMNYVEMTENEMMYVDGGGTFGVNLEVSQATRDKGKAAAVNLVTQALNKVLTPLDNSIWGRIAKKSIILTVSGIVSGLAEQALTSRSYTFEIPGLNFSFCPTISI